MNVLFFLLFLVFLMAPFNSKLLAVFSIHRHGARSPEKFFNANWFPIGKKQLTPLGASQMQHLGEYYRKQYFEQLGLGEERKIYPIYISSPLKRALDSAKNVYKGMFPHEFNGAFNTVPVNITQSFTWNSLPSIPHSGLPILVQNEHTDFLFHGFKKSLCPKAGSFMSAMTHSDEALSQLSHLRESLFPVIGSALKNVMGIDIDPKNMTYSNMKGFYDVLVSTKAHDIQADFGLSDEQFSRLAKERRDFVLNYKLGHPALVRISTTVFLGLLRNAFAAIKSSKHENTVLKPLETKTEFSEAHIKFNTNMVLLSAHDTIINLILNALLTEGEKHKLGHVLDLKYGSHLDFELLEENGHLFVRTFLNKKPLSLEKCNQGIDDKCDLESFEGFLEKAMVKDLKQECSLEIKEL